MSPLELAPALACPAALHGAQRALVQPPFPAATFSTTPCLGIGRQILTYSIRLNIGLGGKSEFVVHLCGAMWCVWRFGHAFGLLYLQDNLNTEFTRCKTPSSRSNLQVAPLCIHSPC